MIDSIRLQDFKGHRDTTVPLGRFTALVGPNGSGKTSVLEALWLQSRLAKESAVTVLSGDYHSPDLSRRGAAKSFAIGSTGKLAGEGWSATISEGGYALGWNGAEPQQVNYNASLGVLAGGGFASAVPSARLYKLNAHHIAAAAYSDQPAAPVGPDGSNTAVALSELKLGYDEEFNRIEEEMRLIVPSVERVRIRQAKVRRGDREVVGSKVYFDFRSGTGVPAHLASEGTLITLALLTILHGPERPGMLLLDDFDQSLHPRAQMELVRLIKRLLVEIDDLQIVVTTHSPYVLDELDPSEIHAFALRDDGTVASKRLSEHPEAERMKGSLTTGQLWTLDPEPEWVIGATAS